jgi:O-antigen/teichoic acid export membrane protein
MVESLASWPDAPLAFALFGVASSVAMLTLAWRGLRVVERALTTAARRVLTNSAMPLAAQLFNRAVDLVFAAFALRLLGVTGNGQYAIAVVTWLYLKTISDFGLSVLVTREVAQAAPVAGRLLGLTTLLRLAILVALAPPLAILLFVGHHWSRLSAESVQAILLLYLSLVPGSFSEAVNSVFNGHERMHLPAALTVLTNFSRFGFGLAALFAGYGVPGLAAVSVLVTSLSALAFRLALRHLSVRPVWSFPLDEARRLLSLAWPLLLNGLLITLFFRLDTFVIQATLGDRALGTYDAAYKFANLLLLIPSYFVLAIFPILSRQAGSERLRDSFELAAKFLLLLAWPIVLGTFVLAPLMIQLLGGSAFLPESAAVLRILVWFAPLHYVNGVAQYVIIAVDQQRQIARAYAIATAFNLVANVLFVPHFGYLAAAVITVLTEIVLFVPLHRAVQRYVGRVSWGWLWLAPLPAVASMAGGMLLSHWIQPVLAVGIGFLFYVVALPLSRVVGPVEYRILRELAGRPRTVGSGA